jgi:ABC-2 type transport system permease protein
MAAAPAAAERRVIARRATWALAAREMRRVLGLWTQTLLPPVVTGLIFLAIFGGALGGRLPTVAGVPYVRSSSPACW